MKIKEKHYVAIDYTLTVDSGTVADKSEPDAPLGFVVGMGRIVPALEQALVGKELGESLQIDIKAADGYGERSDELIQELPRNQFPDDVEIEEGMVFQAQTPHGMMRFTVDSVTDETVKADLNHPMAGKDLHFDVKIVEVREATEAELNPPKSHCDGSHTCSSCSEN